MYFIDLIFLELFRLIRMYAFLNLYVSIQVLKFCYENVSYHFQYHLFFFYLDYVSFVVIVLYIDRQYQIVEAFNHDPSIKQDIETVYVGSLKKSLT
jgi:hypothetical protein